MADQDPAKRLENVLRAEVEESQKLIDSFTRIYSTIFLIRSDGTFTTVKKQDHRLYEVPQRTKFFDLAKAFASNAIYEYDIETFLNECSLKTMRERAEKEKSYSYEFRVLSGESRKKLWYEMTVNQFSDDRILAAIRMRDDIIVRRKVDEKLYSEYASIFLVDLTSDSFRFLFRRKESGFKDTPGGVYSDTIKEYISRVHPDYREAWNTLSSTESIRELLAKEERIELEYPLEGIRKRWRRCAMQVMDVENGVPSSMIMTFITLDKARAAESELTAQIASQKKQLEEQQKQLQEALELSRSANKAKTIFLNNMSHDIRTPMNAIIGYTSLATSNIGNTPLVINYLSKITQSSEHLLSLINDVLDMSRIESGKMSITEKKENLPSLVNNLRDIVQVSANAKQHQLHISTEGIVHPGVICDRLRLNQILLNILSNSIKYTRPGGLISMSVNEKPSDCPDRATFLFHIKDNGMGMSQDFLEKIFVPFTRVSSSTVSGIQGTGLGMSITKSIVDMMGGRISVSSKLNFGTEVNIELPFRLSEENGDRNTETAAITNPEYLKGKKILIVEDNALNSEITTAILDEFGCLTKTATDGSYAVEMMKKASKGDYDLILMDIQMPVMDGYEAARRIRALGTELSRIPIIAMTANAFEEDRKAAYEAGMNDHIAKPIDVSILCSTLEKFLK